MKATPKTVIGMSRTIQLQNSARARNRKGHPKAPDLFPFLSLPAELRNAIYALTLTEENGICLVSKTKNYRRVVELAPFREKEIPQAVPNLAIALVATNRQIYSEASPILYSNVFMLQDTMALHAFMANLNPKTRSLLETISIQSWRGYTHTQKAFNHPGLTLLAEAVNLKQLHFNTLIAWQGARRRFARQIYRDGFHWLEAVGSAKGKKDAAVELIEVFKGGWLRNSWMRRREGPEGIEPRHDLEAFRDELRKLLGGVTEKSSGKKKPKKSKKSGIVSDIR